MNLVFDDEQELFRRSAREFLERYADKSVVRELEASASGFSAELWRGMAELGWMGTIVPEAHGGLGCGLVELGVLFEEIGRAALSGPMLSTVMATLAILETGTEAQKRDLLPGIIGGERVWTLAVEEPEVNYDTRCIALAAAPLNGGHRLSGTKLFVPYATSADVLLVAARTGGVPGEAAGITLFTVAGDSAGLRCSSLKTLAGDRQFQVDLADVAVPADGVLGGAGEGHTVLETVQRKASAIQCAEMVGGAQKQLEMTAEYVKVRQQFGRPIGTFQSVQHRAADMYIDVLGARLAAYRALWALSQGTAAEREVSVAKYFANKACQRVAFSAQQLHGGIGFTLEYDLHFYYRRAKAFELKLGPQPLHLRRLGAAL